MAKPRHAVAPQNAYASADEFQADLRASRHHSSRTMAQRAGAKRLRPLIRAVQVFGFHLATVDLRQSSDKHEEVVAELLATARIKAELRGPGDAKRALLIKLLNDARPLRVVVRQYSAHAQNELAIFQKPPASCVSGFGRPFATTSSATPSGERPARSAAAAKRKWA